jgi:small subunit ribosomal protein S18
MAKRRVGLNQKELKKRYLVLYKGKRCRFCRAGVTEISYKDVDTLVKLCSAQGKIFSRRRSGNCARHQRLVKRAIKYARFLALLPYVGLLTR